MLPSIDFSSFINPLFFILIQHSNFLYSLQITENNPHFVEHLLPKLFLIVKVMTIISKFIAITLLSPIFSLINLLEYENKSTLANTSTTVQHFH
jgi:hypothetical protein